MLWICKENSVNTPVFQILLNRLEVHKKLGGDTGRTADPNEIVRTADPKAILHTI